MAQGRRRSPLAFVFVLLLMAIAVIGVLCALSARRIGDHVAKADADYQNFQSEFDAGDYDAAMTSLQSLCGEWVAVDAELTAWQWEVARHVPVLGEDVNSMQQMASIVRRLSNEAALPVATDAKELLDGVTNVSSLDDVLLQTSQLSQFIQVLSTSREIVTECKEETAALPRAHLGAVEELRGKLVNQIDDIDEAFQQIDALLDFASTLGLSG